MDNWREHTGPERLDAETARIVGASQGWRYDTPTRRRPNRRVVGADTRTIAVQRLLDRLDDDLGMRLRPRDQNRLRRTPLSHPDGFTDAVLTIEGLDPRIVPSLRAQVRRRVAEWLLMLPRTD